MSFVAGFNFRATEGFVTDGPDEVFVAIDDVYPTTKTTANGQSVVFGWDQVLASVRDRSDAIDRRLAGTHSTNKHDFSDEYYFRVDLPGVGDYSITAASGDHSYAAPIQYSLLDGATIFNQVYTYTEIDHFIDAQQNVWNSDDWPANNVPLVRHFTSYFQYYLSFDGDSGDTGGITCPVAHLAIASIDTPKPNPLLRRRLAYGRSA